jgi:hypothetical protein
VADRLSETTQPALLQNSVIGLEALQEVQTSADLMKAANGTVLTCTQCRILLLNSATSYDKRNGDKPSSDGRPRRSVFNSETVFGNHGGPHDDVINEDETSPFDYDVDTSPDHSSRLDHACRSRDGRPHPRKPRRFGTLWKIRTRRSFYTCAREKEGRSFAVRSIQVLCQRT